MDSMQLSNEALVRHLVHIELMLAAILFLLILGALVLIYLFIRMPRQVRKAFGSADLPHQLRDLLDKGEFDKVIELAGQRTSSHPNDVQAHWYLARAYQQKEEWFKALKEFHSVSRIEPTWSGKHVEPYIQEIQEKIRHLKPDDAGQ